MNKKLSYLTTTSIAILAGILNYGSKRDTIILLQDYKKENSLIKKIDDRNTITGRWSGFYRIKGKENIICLDLHQDGDKIEGIMPHCVPNIPIPLHPTPVYGKITNNIVSLNINESKNISLEGIVHDGIVVGSIFFKKESGEISYTGWFNIIKDTNYINKKR